MNKKVNAPMSRRDFFKLGSVSGAALLMSAYREAAEGGAKPELTGEAFNASAHLDPRHIANGWEIPSEQYVDQPYIVQTDDGAWVCVTTTGTGVEGEAGQHIIAMRSRDEGRTWSVPVALEPADGPEASYAVALKVPESGRIYAFYNHNTDNLRQVRIEDASNPQGYLARVDSLGYFVFKYSDDHGVTWSAARYPIPVREFEIDRSNVYGGAVRFFWNVGRPFIHAGAAYVPLIKVGGFGKNFFTRNEGVLLKSDNLLMESDPACVRWETLPDGEIGLRTPPGGGPIAAEHSYSVLSDGSFFAVYRSVDGHPVVSYSRDGGHTWTEPAYMTYADGRQVKHPRAANFAWKCENGKFLYWFHNHGGRDYQDRNPAWLLGGEEADSPEGKVIRWSQPEIVLYSDDEKERLSYPDLVESGGNLYLSETQKTIARVHAVPMAIPQALWSQFERAAVAKQGLLLEQHLPQPAQFPAPLRPKFVDDALQPAVRRSGFTLEMWLRVNRFDGNLPLLDGRDANGNGIALQVNGDLRCLEVSMADANAHAAWMSDPDSLRSGEWQHAVVVVDGGPRIISWIIDGQFNDGGPQRQFGWGRFSADMRDANGAAQWRIPPAFDGEIGLLRVYGRALLTSEVIANRRAYGLGMGKSGFEIPA
ncbi:MAG: exo-alpha-sialidase [Anaerolineae bacterium]|nr:exo-alpha-sialidase [Anaerolineae bacterium]